MPSSAATSASPVWFADLMISPLQHLSNRAAYFESSSMPIGLEPGTLLLTGRPSSPFYERRVIGA